MLIFNRVIFALITALTLYIGNVSNLLPKRGVVRPSPTYAPVVCSTIIAGADPRGMGDKLHKEGKNGVHVRANALHFSR